MHSIRASAALSVSKSGMLYAVGIFHPPSGENGHLPAGYDLTVDELAEIGDLQGVPITLEHAGVSSAVASLLKEGGVVGGLNVGKVLDGLCKTDAKVAPVGVCLDVAVGPKGHYVLFVLDTVAWPVLRLLFPHMQGLSLSHMTYNRRLVPLEISLCIRPARPGCYCSFSGSDYVEALTYMRSQTVGATMENEPSKIETILAKLPEDEQKIISARFETMVAEIQKQRTEAHTAMSKAQELKAKTTEGNIKLLEWGLKNIESQLPDDVQKTFNCNHAVLLPELASNDAEAVRRAVDRLICACSHTMMKMSAAAVPVPAVATRKRARSVTPPPAEPEPVRAALPAGAPKSNEELLREAMANTFGPYNA